jgi:tetratricopeptide (TPR) repeat protein
MNPAESRIEAAWQARREGRHGDAERQLLQVITTSRRTGLRIELIRALKALAHVVRDLGLSRAQGDALLLAHTVRHLGDLHRAAGRVADAERCYHEALSLYRASPAPPPLDLANALRPLALLKEGEGDVETARQLWSEAHVLYVAAGVDVASHE